MRTITRKAAGGYNVHINVRDDLPEGIGEIADQPDRFVVIANPGVAWPTIDTAVSARDGDGDALRRALQASMAAAARRQSRAS